MIHKKNILGYEVRIFSYGFPKPDKVAINFFKPLTTKKELTPIYGVETGRLEIDSPLIDQTFIIPLEDFKNLIK